MYKVQHLLDDERIREFKTNDEFIAFGKTICNENDDSDDFIIIGVDDVVDYIETYCSNLKVLTFVTKDQTINELVNNPEYKENLKEMLELYFTDRPYAYQDWKDWFNKEPHTLK